MQFHILSNEIIHQKAPVVQHKVVPAMHPKVIRVPCISLLITSIPVHKMPKYLFTWPSPL